MKEKKARVEDALHANPPPRSKRESSGRRRGFHPHEQVSGMQGSGRTPRPEAASDRDECAQEPCAQSSTTRRGALVVLTRCLETMATSASTRRPRISGPGADGRDRPQTKVARYALQNASSVAGLMLTTRRVVLRIWWNSKKARRPRHGNCPTCGWAAWTCKLPAVANQRERARTGPFLLVLAYNPRLPKRGPHFPVYRRASGATASTQVVEQRN